MDKAKDVSKFIFKYRLHHIPLWCLYHYLVLVVAYGNPIKAINALQHTPQTLKFLFYVVFQAAAVYFNFYFLIPKFLAKGKYLLYGTYLLATVLVSASIIVTGYYIGATVTSQSFETIYGPGTYCLYFFFSDALPSTLAAMTLAMSIKLTGDWIRSRKKHQVLEKEKLETELNFLKNQFNPHFVFNTINSIFFLIHKNPDKASLSLAKFSELLRYQLYEYNEKLIPLSREVAFIENSIELEKLRLNSNVRVEVNLASAAAADVLIAPFILMTFIENAFKHVSKQSDSNNWIRVELMVKEMELTLQVSNSITTEDVYTEPAQAGIGLKNVQRRLDLIYEGRYQLQIEPRNEEFKSVLKLQLDVSAAHETLADQHKYQIAFK